RSVFDMSAGWPRSTTSLAPAWRPSTTRARDGRFRSSSASAIGSRSPSAVAARREHGLHTGSAAARSERLTRHMYADLFAPDGSFGRAQGREAIALMGRDHFKEQGPNYARHFQANAIIEPMPGGGATGKQYIANIYFGEDGKPTAVGTGGRYEDVYVKTP